MNTSSQSAQKQLGKEVKNFNTDRWNKVCFSIVYKGNYAKFTQHDDLKRELLSTGNTILVEASSYDQIWGIGKGEREDGVEDAINWKGSNLLGFAITTVKQELLFENENWMNNTVEPCVKCGKLTPYVISDDISKRDFYIEGAGQLCEECWNFVFSKI
jgi:hypothetical protein